MQMQRYATLHETTVTGSNDAAAAVLLYMLVATLLHHWTIFADTCRLVECNCAHSLICHLLCMQSRGVLSSGLRHIAHLHGASLIYLGGLKGSTSSRSKDAATDKAALGNFRLMLTHMLFTGMDKRM